MAGQPGRFPEGEPSVKSVLAALARAQEVAMARAAAVGDGEGRDKSARRRGREGLAGSQRGTDQHIAARKQANE